MLLGISLAMIAKEMDAEEHKGPPWRGLAVDTTQAAGRDAERWRLYSMTERVRVKSLL